MDSSRNSSLNKTQPEPTEDERVLPETPVPPSGGYYYDDSTGYEVYEEEENDEQQSSFQVNDALASRA